MDANGLVVGDVIDAVAVGISWGEFAAKPSVGGFLWALLDTATALIPVIPGSGIRHGAKLLDKANDIRVNAQKGKKFEEINGVPSKKRGVKSVIDPDTYRFPDHIDVDNKVIREIKYVKQLALTKQLRDYIAIAKQMNYTLEPVVPMGAMLTAPLRLALKAAEAIITYVPRT